MEIARDAEIEPICDIQTEDHDRQLGSNECSSAAGACTFSDPDRHKGRFESGADAADQSACNDELVRVSTSLHAGTKDEQRSTDNDEDSTTEHLAPGGADEAADEAPNVVDGHNGSLKIGIVGVDVQILEQNWD